MKDLVVFGIIFAAGVAALKLGMVCEDARKTELQNNTSSKIATWAFNLLALAVLAAVGTVGLSFISSPIETSAGSAPTPIPTPPSPLPKLGPDPILSCNAVGRITPVFRTHPILSEGTLELVEGGNRHVVKLPAIISAKQEIKFPGLMPCEGFALTTRNQAGKVIARFSVPAMEIMDTLGRLDFHLQDGTGFLRIESYDGYHREIPSFGNEMRDDPRFRDRVSFDAATHEAVSDFTSGKRHENCSIMRGHEALGCFVIFSFSRSERKGKKVVVRSGSDIFEIEPQLLGSWRGRDARTYPTEKYAMVEIKNGKAVVTGMNGHPVTIEASRSK